MNQKRHLQESSQDSQLANLISRIFADQYIYEHKQFRRKLIGNRKGYVSIKELTDERLMENYFKQNNVSQLDDKIKLLLMAAKQCRQLVITNNRVRRICPFDASLLKQTKPICLEPQQYAKLTISDVRDKLGRCFTSCEDFSGLNGEGDVRLYAAEYRLWSQCDQSELRVISYQQLCRERERQSRLWHNHEFNIYRELETLTIKKGQHLKNRRKNSHRGALQQNSKFGQVNDECKQNERKLMETDRLSVVEMRQLMRDQMQQLSKEDYRLGFQHLGGKYDDLDEACLIKSPNPQFNQLLMGLIKERAIFMQQQQ